MFGFLASKSASENMSSHRAIICPPELLLLEPTAAHGTDGRPSPCQVPHFKREPTEKKMPLACQVRLVRRAVASCARS